MTTGDVLADRYALTRFLGRGGMGSVWAAQDEVLGREVAVKVLNVVHAPADALTRFRREARLLAGLAHPHIVTVYDFGADDERAWLVMELLPGPTLQGLLTDGGPPPIEAVATYGSQCASALSAAHGFDVIHRDIKPANLMLAGDGRCLVLDFGIARLAEPDGTTVTALTEAGMLVGTAPYVAPELVQGGPPTQAVDTYALGAVLFTLVTGHPPFEAETALLTLAQHVHAPVPHPLAERPDTPAALDELIVDLLAKDPSSRPTAEQAALRLDVLDIEPPDLGRTLVLPVQSTPATRVMSPPPPPAPAEDTPSSPVRPRRRLAAAAGLALGAALAALAIVWAVSADNGDQAPPPSTAHGSGTSTTRSTTTTSSTQPPTTSATTPQTPIDRLRDAVRQAAATGGLAGPLANDFSRRVSDLSRSVSQHSRKGYEHQINDFEHRLADARKKGQVSESTYAQIEAALQSLRGDSRGD
jgi:serine/threonine-protein kinase